MNSDLPILTPQEERLEKELFDYTPRSPSPALKARIRAAAAELGVESAPARHKVRRFPTVMRAVVSMAALLMAGVFGVALWQQQSGQPVSNPVAGEAPALPATGSPPDELLIWERLPQAPDSAPTHTERVLVGQKNEGVVAGEDGQPMWKLRYKFVNRAVWEDPETGEKHRMEVPEEREVLVPVRHD